MNVFSIEGEQPTGCSSVTLSASCITINCPLSTVNCYITSLQIIRLMVGNAHPTIAVGGFESLDPCSGLS